MMRRTTSFLLGAVTLFFPLSSASAVEEQATFPDVTEAGHQYQEAVRDVVNRGIMRGNPDGTFRPDASMNRAEFAKTVVTSIGAASEGTACLERAKSQFWDVKADAWYAPYVCVAASRGIIKGYPDGTFKPANPVSFVEVAAMMIRADIAEPEDAQHQDIAPETLSFGALLETWQPAAKSFTPSAVPQEKPWFQDAVETLSYHHAIPTSVTSFDARLTRAEIAEIFARYLSASPEWVSHTYYTLPCDIESRVATSLVDALSRANQICELELSFVTLADLNAALPSLPFLTRISVHGGLNEFPGSILQASRLVELDLSGNNIPSIPNEIMKLSALERLDMSDNALKELPQNVGALPALTFLSIESNEISSLPESLLHATNLLEINAENNSFSDAEILSIQKKFPQISIRF